MDADDLLHARRDRPKLRDIWKLPRVFVDIEDGVSGSLFHSLLWESFKCLHRLQHVEAKRIYIIRRIDRAKEVEEKGDSEKAVQTPTKRLLSASMMHRPTMVKPTFNILLVVSRSDKDGDIDPYLACEAISELVVGKEPKDSTKFHLELSRPGTWSAFKKHISSRTEAWHSSGGNGPWFDIVHFDVHGVFQNETAHLKFLSGSGKNVYQPTFEEVGKLLRSTEIRNTVLFNSCDSAKVTNNERSNMAMKLLSFGVQDVVAMQFPLTSTAASHFVKAFYCFYLSGTYSISEATHLGRQFLHGNRTRDSYLGVQVEITDFVVPVIYHSGAAEASQEMAAILKLPNPSKGMVEVAKFCSSVNTEFKRWGPFFGANTTEWRSSGSCSAKGEQTSFS